MAFSLNDSNVSYVLPDSAHNPRTIQFSLHCAILESYKASVKQRPVRLAGVALSWKAPAGWSVITQSTSQDSGPELPQSGS